MTLDRIDGSSATHPMNTGGVWDDPRAETHAFRSEDELNRNPVDQTRNSVGPEASRLVADDSASAIDIDGTNTNEPQRSERSTADGKPILVDPLHQGDQASVARERTIADGRYITNDQLVFTTQGTGDDRVQVSQRSDGTVQVSVNGESYDVSLESQQELTLRVGAGDDVIEVASNVRVNVVVDGGDGNDSIAMQGSGDNRIDGGAGNDAIDLAGSTGRNDVFGNTGDDGIVGGEAADVLYGGDGDDVIDGGAGTNYMEGGEGDDEFDASQGRNMVSGGLGNDGVVSGSTSGNSIYLGAGDDAADGLSGNDTVYAEAIDVVNFAAGQRDSGQVVVNVEVDPSLGSSVTIKGSDSFVQRVEADLEFLRNSPVGQRMLAAIDDAEPGLVNPELQHTVTIRELANEQNGYASPAVDGVTWGDVQIANGQPGQGTQTYMNYNPSFHMDAFPAPIVVLQHELAHDYNFATGTMFPGTYVGTGPDSGQVPNSERQAVGLPTSDRNGFDFEGDGTNERLFTNPDYLTENGLRTELGLPLRESYTLQAAGQGGGSGHHTHGHDHAPDELINPPRYY